MSENLKRPVTWSDEELRKANIETQGKVGIRDPGAWTFLRTLLAALGAVHPQEHAIAKREAEREAWQKARTSYWSIFGVACTSEDIRDCDAVRDRMYPSILCPSPPPLVLSTGVTIKRADGDRFEIILSNGTPHWGNTISSLGAFCNTREDFTSIARWLGEEEKAR